MNEDTEISSSARNAGSKLVQGEGVRSLCPPEVTITRVRQPSSSCPRSLSEVARLPFPKMVSSSYPSWLSEVTRLSYLKGVILSCHSSLYPSLLGFNLM